MIVRGRVAAKVATIRRELMGWMSVSVCVGMLWKVLGLFLRVLVLVSRDLRSTIDSVCFALMRRVCVWFR